MWEWGKEKITTEAFKKIILTEGSLHKMVFHVAANGGNRELLGKLWVWAKEELTPEDSKDKFLLAKRGELTAFRYHGMQANTELLHEMWVHAKEILTKEELKCKLLLDEDSMGRTAWHNAVDQGHIAELETLWEWAKEDLTPNTLKKIYCQAKTVRDDCLEPCSKAELTVETVAVG